MKSFALADVQTLLSDLYQPLAFEFGFLMVI